VLLLENVAQTAIDLFTRAGYELEVHTKSLSDDALAAALARADAVGIRSKTQLSAQVLAAGKHLLAIGCFCIGTNQVDLEAAEARGIPVFNSPFSNSRSVGPCTTYALVHVHAHVARGRSCGHRMGAAELTIAEIVALARRLGERNNEMHRGEYHLGPVRCPLRMHP
jgi:D-3-phosphoglycerate dehydrogenase / 2-oxoglutarate reductase